MPRPRTTPVWKSDTYLQGYCEQWRGRAVRFRWKHHQKVTDLQWREENREQAVARLDAWIESLKNPRLLTTQAVEVTTVKQAMDHFRATKKKTMSPGVWANYRISFRYFFPGNLPLDPDTLEPYLVNRLEELATLERTITVKGKRPFKRGPLAQRTIAGMAQRVSRLMQYAVDRGWMRRNPMAGMVPKKERKEKVITYSDADFVRLLNYFVERADQIEAGAISMRGLAEGSAERFRQYALFWMFLATTGMRLHEALKLRWSEYCTDPDSEPHISPVEISILGKGKKWRVFPLTGDAPQIARVRYLVARMREYRHANKGYVFPWRDTGITIQLQKALAALGIDGGNRPAHAMRATCEAIWEREQVEPLVMTRLLGHSLKVYEDHYQQKIEAEQLARALGMKSRRP